MFLGYRPCHLHLFLQHFVMLDIISRAEKKNGDKITNKIVYFLSTTLIKVDFLNLEVYYNYIIMIMIIFIIIIILIAIIVTVIYIIYIKYVFVQLV